MDMLQPLGEPRKGKLAAERPPLISVAGVILHAVSLTLILNFVVF
jgi:hypothetical protein